MMNYQKGVKLALLTAMFSGVAVLFNRMVVKTVGDPLVFTTLKNLGVAVVVGVILATKTKRGQMDWRKIEKRDWIKLAAIGIIGGSLPFYLFFKGLMLASSAKAALLHKTLIFWVAMWAVPALKEKISFKQLGALGLIFASNFVIGGLGKWNWGIGETMILGATILWAVENVIAKIALKKVEADVVGGARMIIGSLLLLSATLVSGRMGLIFKLNAAQWGLTLVTVGLLTGYVMSWYRALQQAPVTLVATVLSLGAVITNILSGIFVTHSLNIGFIYQSILLVAGVWFFYINSRLLQADIRQSFLVKNR
jgi:drug/metabolite transporter (DMT)-like permease